MVVNSQEWSGSPPRYSWDESGNNSSNLVLVKSVSTLGDHQWKIVKIQFLLPWGGISHSFLLSRSFPVPNQRQPGMGSLRSFSLNVTHMSNIEWVIFPFLGQEEREEVKWPSGLSQFGFLSLHPSFPPCTHYRWCVLDNEKHQKSFCTLWFSLFWIFWSKKLISRI